MGRREPALELAASQTERLADSPPYKYAVCRMPTLLLRNRNQKLYQPDAFRPLAFEGLVKAPAVQRTPYASQRELIDSLPFGEEGFYERPMAQLRTLAQRQWQVFIIFGVIHKCEITIFFANFA